MKPENSELYEDEGDSHQDDCFTDAHNWVGAGIIYAHHRWSTSAGVMY